MSDQHYLESSFNALFEVASDLGVSPNDLLQILSNRHVTMTRSPRVRDLSSCINVNHNQQDTQRASRSLSDGWLETLPEAGHHFGLLSNSTLDSPQLSGTNLQNLDIQLELAPSTALNVFSKRNEPNFVQQGVSNLFSSGATGFESRREEMVALENYEGSSFTTHPEAVFQKRMDFFRISQNQINSMGLFSMEPRTSDMSTDKNRDIGLDEELQLIALQSPQLNNAPTTTSAQSQKDSSTLSMSWATLTPSTPSDQPPRSNTYSIPPETAASDFAAAVNFGPCSRTWELPPRVSTLQQVSLLYTC